MVAGPLKTTFDASFSKLVINSFLTMSVFQRGVPPVSSLLSPRLALGERTAAVLRWLEPPRSGGPFSHQSAGGGETKVYVHPSPVPHPAFDAFATELTPT